MPKSHRKDNLPPDAQMVRNNLRVTISLHPILNWLVKRVQESLRDFESLLKLLSYVTPTQQMVHRFIIQMAHNTYQVEV